MKLLVIAIVASSAPVHAPPRDPLEDILASQATLLAALGDPVTVGLILWDEPACTRRFGAPATITGQGRGELAKCLAGLHLTRAKLDTGSPVTAIGSTGAVVAFGLRNGKIAALDAAAPDRRDSPFPTVLRWWINGELTPSERTRAAIARTPRKTVDAIFKICHDEQGTVTSRRIVRPSGLAGFDEEALAYFKTIDQVEPVVRGASGATAPVAACSIFAFRYPELLAGDRLGDPSPALPPSSPAPIT